MRRRIGEHQQLAYAVKELLEVLFLFFICVCGGADLILTFR